MTPHPPIQRHYLPFAAAYLPMAAAVSGLFSIAACHILMPLALLALLALGRPLRFPPIALPLSLFFALTLVSLALSDQPLSGFPQIKKFYVFLMLCIVYTGLQSLTQARHLLLALSAAGLLSALWSLVQFYLKWTRALASHQNFYDAYIADRITGFMSHWMTFAGHMMTVFLILLAFVYFARHRRIWLPYIIAALAILSLALILGFTRSIWPATAAGAIFLTWHWNRWAILALPILLATAFFTAPQPVRVRIESIYRPGAGDSNLHREVLRRTGWRMIQAHPWFGVGPQQVKQHFLEFVPADVPKPIPTNWYYDHLHNTYIHYAAERGLPALCALLWMLARILYDFARALRTLSPGRDDRRFILLAALAVTIGILTGGLLEVNLGDSEVLGLFLAVIACGYVAVQEPAHAG
ncbi:MAG: O-antigen ligase family protein [Acidobacteriia bacterium]|nr:O-antigen ligase family protein [Terriglobia bacterium]